ncbi:MAG: TetR/AcrR family transcriptional regulator, partial [Streptosporangiaceae bacterium]
MNTASELVAPASGAAAPAAPLRRRQRNARGQGARLTGDIVTGALALIERSGSDEAVTLRAVAREVGISAPSIYAHFADRDAIVMAVVLRVFDELAGAIEQGTASAGQDPVARLEAGCEAYVSFGLAYPARYGVLFSRHSRPPEEYCAPVPLGPDGRPVLEFGAEAFALLVRGIEDCAGAGASASA